MDRFKRLEDYGIIGNLETCALVGRDGSIDWLCLPHIDSPSVFGAILDPRKGGSFHIRPDGPTHSHQAYIPLTNVLITVFDTPHGRAELTDFMPVQTGGDTEHRLLLRKMHCSQGAVRMEASFEPRFDYGQTPAEFRLNGSGVLASAQGAQIFLETSAPLGIKGTRAQGRFPMKEGETHWFILHFDGTRGQKARAAELLSATVRTWTDWLKSSKIFRPLLQGPWHELVIRSALVLKLLTIARTGAVIAAPTTSLPESLGGIRNWDYRYTWIRDSAFTIQAFEHLGYYPEALKYFQWLKTVCAIDERAGGPPNIKIAYTFDGRDVPVERELPHLSGYRNSTPVRVGNAASGQSQRDVYGEILHTFYMARHHERGIIALYWPLIRVIADHVCETWEGKDSGIWELRTEPRHLTHSKLMCWVALDRGVRLAKEFHLGGAVARWAKERDRIRAAILEKGFSRKLNSFVQAFDYEVLDSSALLIPSLGFLPADDSRVRSTIDAVYKGLMTGDFLHRYDGDDGLPGKEGAFLICSFWLVNALAMAGEVERAEDEFLKILRYRSPLGLFSEEIDPRSGLQIGNTPQALSHIGLINSALYLGKYQGREGLGPELIGSSAR